MVLGVLCSLVFWERGAVLEILRRGVLAPPPPGPPDAALAPEERAGLIGRAISELDLERAAHLLRDVRVDSPQLALERARLALYRGDCDTAVAILSQPTLTESEATKTLSVVSESCARATAGAATVEDREQGIWLRLQDDADAVLVPFVISVAARAMAQLERDLGTRLPRPLRIELVRDQFSLSAVSGLPLEAAETTGTVGVARWGRVVLLSPRAAPRGYPWEDTLAHELSHLYLTRASGDRAPLWLQEGIAKRQETRWRTRRPFDDAVDYDQIARTALKQGTAVGIQNLGPSIALLPTPEAASTAYAEVASFTQHWLREKGAQALWLLLADLKGLPEGQVDTAMRSATGLGVDVWIRLWTQALLEKEQPPLRVARKPALTVRDVLGVRETIRRVRLSDLLAQQGRYQAALDQLANAKPAETAEPAVRWRAARAALAVGQAERARALLGDFSDVNGNHGGWLGLRGHFARLAGEADLARDTFGVALAIDPLAEDVACEGRFRLRRPGTLEAQPDAHLPQSPESAALCEEARRISRD